MLVKASWLCLCYIHSIRTVFVHTRIENGLKNAFHPQAQDFPILAKVDQKKPRTDSFVYNASIRRFFDLQLQTFHPARIRRISRSS